MACQCLDKGNLSRYLHIRGSFLICYTGGANQTGEEREMSDEELSQTTTTTVQETPTIACPHPEAVGKRCGDDIPDERQKELLKLHEEQVRWLSETGPDCVPSQSPFAQATDPFRGKASLTGAEVCFLARETSGPLVVLMGNLHLEGARLDGAHLEGADLGLPLSAEEFEGPHLEGAGLNGAHLERAGLNGAHLEAPGSTERIWAAPPSSTPI
jgi:hypothetical protein